MRIRVDYATSYDYALPAGNVVQVLRIEPGGHDHQHIVAWRLDIDSDGSLRRGLDAFGNIVHLFYADAPLRRLTLQVSGEVDTEESHGVVRGTAEPLPLPVFLRQTPLTAPDEAIAGFARDIAAAEGSDVLALCHALTRGLHGRLDFDTDVTHAHSDAAHAFALGAGVCQDFAHVFLAAARLLEIPARYVSGHLVRSDGFVTQPASHAWVEAHVPALGWVGFDPTNGISTTDSYLRVAVGLDYLDAAPVRGARRGGGTETMQVSVTARQAGRQAQGQSQVQAQGQVQG